MIKEDEMLKKALIFIMLVSMLATTVSAVKVGDTKITDGYYRSFHDLNVNSGEKIEIIAILERYNSKLIFTHSIKDWTPCVLRDLDLGVSDSRGKMIYTDKARTGFFSKTANFSSFKLKEPGNYTCYIKYAGDLKNCQTQFNIHVS